MWTLFLWTLKITLIVTFPSDLWTFFSVFQLLVSVSGPTAFQPGSLPPCSSASFRCLKWKKLINPLPGHIYWHSENNLQAKDPDISFRRANTALTFISQPETRFLLMACVCWKLFLSQKCVMGEQPLRNVSIVQFNGFLVESIELLCILWVTLTYGKARKFKHCYPEWIYSV